MNIKSYISTDRTTAYIQPTQVLEGGELCFIGRISLFIMLCCELWASGLDVFRCFWRDGFVDRISGPSYKVCINIVNFFYNILLTLIFSSTSEELFYFTSYFILSSYVTWMSDCKKFCRFWSMVASFFISMSLICHLRAINVTWLMEYEKYRNKTCIWEFWFCTVKCAKPANPP